MPKTDEPVKHAGFNLAPSPAETLDTIDCQAKAELRKEIEELRRTVEALQSKLPQQSGLLAERQGDLVMERLIATEKIAGEVIGLTDSEVVIQFDPGETDQEVFAEACELSKFNLGHAPEVGEQVEFEIRIRLIPPTDPTDSARNPDGQPIPRRNVITGDHRF